jgi:hypothetical protein
VTTMIRSAKVVHAWILGLSFVAGIVVVGAGGLMFLAAFVGVSGWGALILAHRWKGSNNSPRIVQVALWCAAPVGSLGAIVAMYAAAFGNQELRTSLPIYGLGIVLQFVSLVAGLTFDPFPDPPAGESPRTSGSLP